MVLVEVAKWEREKTALQWQQEPLNASIFLSAYDEILQ